MPLPRTQTLASPTRLRSPPACCPLPSCLVLLTSPCSARSSALVRLGKSGLSGQHCSQVLAPPAASRPLYPWCTTRTGLFSGKPASPPPRRVSHTQPSASASPSPMPSCSPGHGHTDSSPTWLHHARLALKNSAPQGPVPLLAPSQEYHCPEARGRAPGRARLGDRKTDGGKEQKGHSEQGERRTRKPERKPRNRPHIPFIQCGGKWSGSLRTTAEGKTPRVSVGLCCPELTSTWNLGAGLYLETGVIA